MQSFENVDRAALRWVRSENERNEYDLLAGAELVGTLRWTKDVGSLAKSETSVDSWTLKRGGFLNPHVTVREIGSSHDLARLTAHLSYSLLELPDGSVFRLQRAGLLIPAWQLTDSRGTRLLHVEPVRESRRLVGGVVVVEEPARSLPVLPLLAIVSWYFIVLAWFEDEVVAATSAALVATL